MWETEITMTLNVITNATRTSAVYLTVYDYRYIDWVVVMIGLLLNDLSRTRQHFILFATKSNKWFNNMIL